MNETRNLIEMGSTAEKVKYPRAQALRVARELCDVLGPLCETDDAGVPLLKVCGSLRRMKEQVGDVEMVFVPRTRSLCAEERDLFGVVTRPAKTVYETHLVMDHLVSHCALSRRLKCDGSQTWGQWIRLAVHVASGVPVDFFACSRAAWWNIVACRTGGARSNVAVASAAIVKGWRWDMGPESPGFWRPQGLGREYHAVRSEAEVFEFVGMPCKKPEERE